MDCIRVEATRYAQSGLGSCWNPDSRLHTPGQKQEDMKHENLYETLAVQTYNLKTWENEADKSVTRVIKSEDF